MGSNIYLLKKDAEITNSHYEINELKEDLRLSLIEQCKDIEELDSGYLKSDYIDEDKTVEQIRTLCKYEKEHFENSAVPYTLCIYKYVDME